MGTVFDGELVVERVERNFGVSEMGIQLNLGYVVKILNSVVIRF